MVDIRRERQIAIEKKIATLTLEEKVGQLFMWSITDGTISSDAIQMLQSLEPGGVLILGNFTQKDLQTLTSQIKRISLRLRPFIALDEEGGVVKRLQEDTNPGAQTLSSYTREKQCRIWEETSHLLKASGISVNFGIIGDIGWDPKSFIYTRTYSNDVKQVSNYVSETIKCSKPILTTVKHFPGHGRVSADTHTEIPKTNISMDVWTRTDAIPFQTAIEDAVDFIMVGHMIYESLSREPASLASAVYQKIRAMGFDGIIITDDISMLTRQQYPIKDTVRKALVAGADTVLVVTDSSTAKELYTAMTQEIKNGLLSKNDLDARITRIIKKKYPYLRN